MKEQEIVRLTREALDEAAEHLPWRVTHRLATAREAALAQAARVVPVAVGATGPLVALAGHGAVALGGGDSRANREGQPRLAARIAAIVAPILIVAAGLFGIAEWDSRRSADDLAELDEAVLTDEVPISAYADRGFGVFLRNVGQGDPQ